MLFHIGCKNTWRRYFRSHCVTYRCANTYIKNSSPLYNYFQVCLQSVNNVTLWALCVLISKSWNSRERLRGSEGYSSTCLQGHFFSLKFMWDFCPQLFWRCNLGFQVILIFLDLLWKNEAPGYFLKVMCITVYITAFSSFYFYTRYSCASNCFPVLMLWFLFNSAPAKCFCQVHQFQLAKGTLLNYWFLYYSTLLFWNHVCSWHFTLNL